MIRAIVALLVQLTTYFATRERNLTPRTLAALYKRESALARRLSDAVGDDAPDESDLMLLAADLSRVRHIIEQLHDAQEIHPPGGDGDPS